MRALENDQSKQATRGLFANTLRARLEALMPQS